MKRHFLLTVWIFCALAAAAQSPSTLHYPDSRPLTRWWWFADTVQDADIRAQLRWLQANGFGGVELAFVYPYGGRADAPRRDYLGPEWAASVAYAQHCADSLGLHMDLTFGTLWPFGGSFVASRDGSKTYGDTATSQFLRLSWEHPVRGRVLNHLDEGAFDRYADHMLGGLQPALEQARTQGRRTGWFCDSWEVHSARLWTAGLDSLFSARFGYDVKPWMDSLYRPGSEGVLYDYRSLVAELALQGFYKPFARKASEHNSFVRAQVAGAPVDLLEAYAVVDVPESEALLYPPGYSRIPASAAALSGKAEVSAEAFTCLYGWNRWPGPGPAQGGEDVRDLKLLADALFAHGVNQMVWHGMPFNTPPDSQRFFASVHVGPDGRLAPSLVSFNRYMQRVSAALKEGRVASHVAVYLPTEEAWRAGEYPEPLASHPGSWAQFEMRYVQPPAALAGHQPLWVSRPLLEQARVEQGRLLISDQVFHALVVDVAYLDAASLSMLDWLASEGLRIAVLREPGNPSYAAFLRFARQPEVHTSQVPAPPPTEYGLDLARLLARPSVLRELEALKLPPPLVRGVELFWARQLDDRLRVFIPHPDAHTIIYPMELGQAAEALPRKENVTLQAFGKQVTLTLDFAPAQSFLVDLHRNGEVTFAVLPGVEH